MSAEPSSEAPSGTQIAEQFRRVGGVTGGLISELDWARSPVGPIAGWPSSLRTIVATLLASRHPMFLWWGPELIQFYNDAYVPSFGVGKHPAAMGQRGADCWGEIWPIIWPQIDDVMSRAKASWNEDALVPIFRNGRIEEVFWTYGYSPVFDESGRVGGTLVVCTETTSRVLAERRLKLIRHLGDGLADCEDAGAIADSALHADAAGYDIPFALRYQTDPASGEPALVSSAGIEPTALPAIDGAVRALLRASDGGRSSAGLHALAAPAESRVWPEPVERIFVHAASSAAIGTLVFGTSPRLGFDTRYAEFFGDLGDQVDLAAARVEAARARAAIEAERRNLLLQAPMPAALVTGPAHVYELANPAYRRMVHGRDVVGKAYVEAFPEVDGAELPRILDRVYETGLPFSADEYVVALDRHGDGKVEDCYFKFNLEPVRDGSGAVYGIMAMALDVTEQVKSRRELERTNRERQALVEQLESINRSKDAFLATVSHELRTPLSAILGWARLLRAGELSAEKVSRALESVERNALAQVQLIDDLLDVSRIVSGKLRLDVQPFSLPRVVDAAVESIQHAVAAKGIRLRSVIDPNAGPILGDPQRVQQVMWNLLSNAVKFTPKGGSVSLAVRRVDSGVELSVTDTGQGLPPHLLSTIFERFQQADGSAARVHGGLGLGLAISRHIVELHGGTIEARSEGEGRGAVFAVLLPVAPFVTDGRGPFRHSAPAEGPTLLEKPKELQGLTVLVVDDEADTREVLTEVLQQMGISVLAAATAEEALAVLDRASPRVIVSDVGMANTDGYRFIESVRQRGADRGGRTVALALTAYASAEDRRRALRAGFQMHLAKPVEPAELVAALANLAQLALAMD